MSGSLVGKQVEELCGYCHERPTIKVYSVVDDAAPRLVVRACGVCLMKPVDLALGWGISAQVAQAYASAAAGRRVRQELARARRTSARTARPA